MNIFEGLDRYRMFLVRRALLHNRGNVAQTARELGVNRNSLITWLKEDSEEHKSAPVRISNRHREAYPPQRLAEGLEMALARRVKEMKG